MTVDALTRGEPGRPTPPVHGKRRGAGSIRVGLALPALLIAATSACGSFARTASGLAIATTVLVGDFSRPPDSVAGRSPPEVGYFFKNRGYGTDAYIGPLDVLLNKGFSTAQWEGRERDIFSSPYGWRAVWRSVAHPDATAQKHNGWKEVLKTNFIPFSGGEWNNWAWYPNYMGHIVEGGIAYRRLQEWYAFQGVPASRAFAFVTAYAASIINEAYEIVPYRPWVDENGSANTSMDLLFFDPAGMLIFESDRVSRFFSEALHANVWPLQASITGPSALLMNNGHHLVFKIPLKFTDSFALFFKSGVGAEVGLTHHLDGGHDISWGVGAEGRQQYVDSQTRAETVGVTPSAGVWVDRNGSLLGSLLLDRHTDRRVSLNVYPGVLDFGGGRFGGWLVLNEHYRPFVGFSGNMMLGGGLGWGF